MDSPQRDPASHWDPNATPAAPTATRESRRASSRSAKQSSGARIGRPAAAGLLAIAVIAAALPVARVLLAGAFGPTPSTGAVVSGVLLLLGLPLGAVGLHGLSSDAAKAAGPTASWLRPPVAYLVVALVLFIAAGLAA
jgi:hypothetical protein